MREFIALAQLLNLTEAAKIVHVTQPALSNHLRSMEDELGITLVERTSNKVRRLTAAGQHFLNVADNIVAKYDQMLPELHRLSEEPEGRIDIQLPLDAYIQSFIARIAAFRQLNPNYELVLKSWSVIDNIEAVRKGKADCAILGPADDETLRRLSREDDGPAVAAVPYAWTEVLLWADKNHPYVSEGTAPLASFGNYKYTLCASVKSTTWHVNYAGIFKSIGADCGTIRRFADSLEGFFLSETNKKDLVLCAQDLAANYSLLAARTERAVFHFSPRLYVPFYLVYRVEPDNKALLALVKYLQEEFSKLKHPDEVIRSGEG